MVTVTVYLEAELGVETFWDQARQPYLTGRIAEKYRDIRAEIKDPQSRPASDLVDDRQEVYCSKNCGFRSPIIDVLYPREEHRIVSPREEDR